MQQQRTTGDHRHVCHPSPRFPSLCQTEEDQCRLDRVMVLSAEHRIPIFVGKLFHLCASVILLLVAELPSVYQILQVSRNVRQPQTVYNARCNRNMTHVIEIAVSTYVRTPLQLRIRHLQSLHKT